MVYAIVRREADAYRLNDADGAFASAPADSYIPLTEDTVIIGRYQLSESRTVWNDGRYTVAIYEQAGGSPSPVNDAIIGSGEMYIVSDAEAGITGIPGAVWAKQLEGLTAEEIMRIILAPLAGKREGLGTAIEKYMGQDGVTPRITFSPDAQGNGLPVLNGAP